MDVPRQLTSRLARQLGRPSGPLGLLVGRRLNRRNAGMVTAAVDAADPRPGESAGDIGFGGGVGLGLLLERVGEEGHVWGVDLSPTMHRAAERRFRRERAAGRLTVHEGTVLALPLEDASLDAVISVHVLYFVPDLTTAFSELLRVLRPGGRLAVALGDPEAMEKLPVTEHGFRLRPVAELTSSMEAAGLQLVEHRRVGRGERAAHVLLARRPAAN